MVTGDHAFTGADHVELLAAVTSGAWRPLPPDLPARWRGTIDALLQVDPALRVPDCATARRLWNAPVDVQDQQDLFRALALRPAGSAGVPSVPPLTPPVHNLPASRDRFFGRTRARSEVTAHLRGGARLVTLLGTGGLGKTRLALELGRGMVTAWPGGVWFVSLADVHTAGGILSAVASALDVQLGRSPDTQLAVALATRGRMLLILDNFEQIVDFAAETAGRWLDTAPELHVLATSRTPLRLEGEVAYGVSLLAEAEAVELFVERARQAAPGRPIAPDDDVRRLVQQLDRLPLAIELAAARSRALGPRQLLDRMSRRFAVLQTRSTERHARQRTLRATLGWSWDMLGPLEQSVLAQCSVFEGGFTLEAAEAVIAVDGDVWVEDVLYELVDRSLLVRGENSFDAETRLSLLVSVHAFAREQLPADDRVFRRHAEHFAALADDPDRPAHHRREERDNLMAACRWAAAAEAPALVDACVRGLHDVFRRHGPVQEGGAFVESVLAIAPRRSPALLRCLGLLVRKYDDE